MKLTLLFVLLFAGLVNASEITYFEMCELNNCNSNDVFIIGNSDWNSMFLLPIMDSNFMTGSWDDGYIDTWREMSFFESMMFSNLLFLHNHFGCQFNDCKNLFECLPINKGDFK